MLIITGTGRCGTATLAKMFKGHHEFRVQYLLDKYFLNADPLSDPFRSIQKRIEAMLDLHQGIDRGTFIDSSNLYIHFIDALCALDPSTRVILSVRNGKDFVRSALSRRWHEQNIFGTFPLRDDPYYEEWPSMNPLQKNAWIWVFRNTRALGGLKKVPEGNKMIVKIEDIRKFLEIKKIEIKVNRGDVVEIIGGPFKNEKGKVTRVDEAKEELTIELLDAAIPIPITIPIESAKVIEAAEKSESK